jgi:hypothetical protein
VTVPKLNQIIAIENGIKTSTQKDLTEAHHALQKPALLNGIARTYKPKDDEGEKYPDESTRVQVTASDMLRSTGAIMTRLFDVTATKDFANCVASADVVVDGKVLLAKAPVTFLLFLEKRLVDLETFIKKIPTLDPSESWTFDQAQNCFASTPSETVKTKKIRRNHVKAEATDKHPAQVDTYDEDTVVGHWRTIKYSGAIAATTSTQLLGRVTKLREAVKFAREEANGIPVEMRTVGGEIFKFLLGPLEGQA